MFVEPRHPLAAVAIDDVNVAVGRDGDVGGIGPVELLRGGAFLFDVADDEKDFAFEVGLIDTSA